MKSFWELNKHKVIFAFSISSAIFSLLIALPLYVLMYLDGEEMDITNTISIFLSFGVGSPLFIVFLAWVTWWSHHIYYKGIFSKPPFNALDSIGFESHFLFQNTKHTFTIETKIGYIGGYKLKCFFTTSLTTSVLHFIPETEYKQFPYDQFKRLETCYNNQGVFWMGSTLAKSYEVKKSRSLSIEQVQSELNEFIEILKKEGLLPLYSISTFKGLKI